MEEFKGAWVAKEFAGLDLGDKRLNARLMAFADELSNHPAFPISQACEDWGATKAAYRFFRNDKFTEHDLLRPHVKSTAERCFPQPVVLVIQDMTVLGYSHHPKTKGLGNISAPSGLAVPQHGLNMHAALAVTVEGLPLGLLSNNIFARKVKRDKSNRVDHLLPTEEKESYKWSHALEETHEALAGRVASITICGS